VLLHIAAVLLHIYQFFKLNNNEHFITKELNRIAPQWPT
jgi:hypothetical protein